jgi:hypothetical protein
MSSIIFKDFGKIPRLSRECVVTEKLDGTNACVAIDEEDGKIYAQSRSRLIYPDDDNYGFARWVRENEAELAKLGHGHHYGEWWGAGIQRGYGLTEKRFSLFNVSRWADDAVRPACCHVVPMLYAGAFCTAQIDNVVERLREHGSMAAPGFGQPEGVIVYHVAAGSLFKKTCTHDDEPKLSHIKKERVPRPPKDPSKGGRRIEQLPFSGPDRRNGSHAAVCRK